MSRWLRDHLSWLAAAAVTVIVLAYVQAPLALRDTMPAGGDLGAHTWGAWFLRDLLADGHVTGWTDDWFGGFPAFRFYFPLPAVAAAILSYVLPVGVAQKLVVVAAAAALPGAVWWSARATGLARPAPALLAVASTPFLFMPNNLLYGGSLLSTLIGEFSFAAGLAAAVAFLGQFDRTLRSRHGHVAAGVLGAATVLTHAVPALFAALGAVVLLAVHRRLRPGLAVGGLAAGLSAFWWLPMLAGRGYTYAFGTTTPQTPQLLAFPVGILLPVAAAGAWMAWRRRATLPLVAAVWAVTGVAAAVAAPHTIVHPVRFVPFYYLGVHLLAGYAIVSGWRRRGRQPAVAEAAGVGILVVLLLVWTGFPGFVSRDRATELTDPRNLAARALLGYGGQEGGPALEAIVGLLDDTGRRHGCGRLLMEDHAAYYVLGSPYVAGMFPVWTDGCIDAAVGLYGESTATTPFMVLTRDELSGPQRHWTGKLDDQPHNPALAVDHSRQLGIRYLLLRRPETIEALRSRDDVGVVGSAGGWTLLQIDDVALVEPLDEFDVDPDLSDWETTAVDRFLDQDATAVAAPIPGMPRQGVDVSDVEVTDNRISFTVEKPGIPVLVKVSYYPTWKADGADGPYRATPNWMVVVPTATEVDLVYSNGPAATAGTALSAAAVAAAAAELLRRHTRRRRLRNRETRTRSGLHQETT